MLLEHGGDVPPLDLLERGVCASAVAAGAAARSARPRSAGWMSAPRRPRRARSSTLRSSRTLPGQSCAISAVIASRETPSMRRCHLGAEPLEQVVDEQRDVLLALAQRRERTAGSR